MINMLKDLYRRFSILGTFVLLSISVCFFMMILVEYEIKIKNLTSVYECGFQVIVNMTTVGYGDKSAVS